MAAQLIIATGNLHKLKEIREIFSSPGLVLVGLDGVPGAPEVEEDRDTFESNAIKKAATLAAFSGAWTMADDSGLEVDALGGAPGIYSARYAGEPADYAANNVKLLRELSGDTTRSARFRCVIALCTPAGAVRTVEGCCEGRIATAERGIGGFGYDPLFIPEGHATTFAEMTAEAKNAISHRGRALATAAVEWRDRLHALIESSP
ncbi:MAG: RdgB/HAM1 family non-canonical purine NTP pyrophosphatase [Verrucomicrobia bacterium]|jgi:XTP/dITP diphosphohydrolase|nr:RdgB/HAM1 family non-canonical purine NTP pyrophosphatase [Verrucomicrobiota bacterium]MBT7065098.1 RdgB/HAM1 family non-canonical purine NTP pyrophosphatase [Verrucomicrobiota bacterium]MBT7701678.1 RdgB/HAM1 family non-canonical purine NTP pyrophosphatase [Verrucomicrobiota bacterium]